MLHFYKWGLCFQQFKVIQKLGYRLYCIVLFYGYRLQVILCCAFIRLVARGFIVLCYVMGRGQGIKNKP
jgi:hypothetical protein